MADNVNKGIPGFSPQEFAENITSQASEVIPPEFQPADKQFIAEVIKKFCFMAGDAIVQDPNAGLNADQASLICQFIGEWTFHKSIDLTRGGVDINLREQVLQKVAFTIFEIAKQAIKKSMSQEDLIPLVETHVNKSFKNALEDLKKRNIIDEKTLKQAESQSNVDAMAQASIEQETRFIKYFKTIRIFI